MTGNMTMPQATAAQGTAPAYAEDFAFDPADTAAGMASFLHDGAGFFDQVSQMLAPIAAPATRHQPVPVAIGQAAAWPQRATDISHPGFVAGTLLMTDRGQKAVQDIRPGDRILTRDRGFRPVVWVARGTQAAAPAPVMIDAGALGPSLPDRPMQVSPDQCLMVEGPRTRLLFGAHEVLVPAAHLVGYPGIDSAIVAPVEYIRIMCASHEVIWADGIWTESFQAASPALMDVDAAQRIELETVFSQSGIDTHGQPAARRTLQRHEADLLLA